MSAILKSQSGKSEQVLDEQEYLVKGIVTRKSYGTDRKKGSGEEHETISLVSISRVSVSSISSPKSPKLSDKYQKSISYDGKSSGKNFTKILRNSML